MGTTATDIPSAAALPTYQQRHQSRPQPSPQPSPAARWPLAHRLTILSLWSAIFAAGLAGPALLDDADATHAQAVQSMLRSGDWVTLHVNGVRYLEKAPLSYWVAAVSLRLFPAHPAFAIHLPLALTVLGLALLGYAWARRAFGPRAALYTAVFTLTSTGVFLFTRVFIPDALLSLLLALTLYCLLRALEPSPNSVILSGARSAKSKDPEAIRLATTARTFQPTLFAYAMWTSLALAVLAKGLVALVFFFSAALIFLLLSGKARHWRRLRPFTGVLLLLAIAAPWHVLAGLRNTGGAGGHGFFWFYFVNEHFLRFLGRRVPRDYNKLPTALYWSLHLVWLFPWSLFAPAALLVGWRNRSYLLSPSHDSPSSRPEQRSFIALRSGETRVFSDAQTTTAFPRHTVILLLIFSTLVLVFFSFSTNQEYYTFPVYLPLLMLLAAALTHAGKDLGAPSMSSPIAHGWGPQDAPLRRSLTISFAAFTALGAAAAVTLSYGLWTSRHLPFVPDIGALLAHRGVGDYTLSMSHFFDLTGPSFAALRLPAALAALTFAIGPAIAWALHHRRRDFAALMTVALTSTAFLIAAHIALVRFAPMLSSQTFAATIQRLEQQGRIQPDTRVLLYGDQAYGSSIPFYLHRQVLLVDGRSTSMLFGSTFPDAPPIFLTSNDLFSQWGSGPRKILFVPFELRDHVSRLLLNSVILQETSGKLLLTDRPLDTPISRGSSAQLHEPATDQAPRGFSLGSHDQ